MKREKNGGRIYLAVIGGGDVDEATAALAFEIGKLAAAEGWVLLNGGLGGVMEAASRGAAEVGGIVIGLLPGTDRSEGNRFLSLALPTGLGHLRNAVLVTMSDAVIAVDGGFGTLSEIAFARLREKPVVGVGVENGIAKTTGGEPLFASVAGSPAGAVARVKELLAKKRESI